MFAQMLSSGPTLQTRKTNRTGGFKPKVLDELEKLMPGTRDDITAKCDGKYGRTTVYRYLEELLRLGRAAYVYVGGTKGGRRYEYQPKKEL